jgi:hypothetical protein
MRGAYATLDVCTSAPAPSCQDVRPAGPDLAPAYLHPLPSAPQEVEQHWEKRLRDGMNACERKFGEEATEWERRLRDTDLGWQAKLAELEALWRESAFLCCSNLQRP